MAKWWHRLLGRVPRPTDWDQLELGPVELVGTVQPLETLEDPIDGTQSIVVDYRAWPPSTTAGVDGAAVVGDRAFQVSAVQAVEFLLESGGRSVLVRPERGEDVLARHQALEAQYGINLRTEVRRVVPGDEVVVRGRIVHLSPSEGSPMRAQPHRAVLDATQIRHR